MKTINNTTRILSLGLLMFSTLIAISNTTPTSEKPNRVNSTEKTIRDFLKFPQVLIPAGKDLSANTTNTHKVEVLFTTDKNGAVNFVLAKTRNNNLKSEIEKQFIALRFNELKSDVVHSVVLNFKTI